MISDAGAGGSGVGSATDAGGPSGATGVGSATVGASLDCCRNDSSAEAVFNEARETWNKVSHWVNAENILVIRDLLDGVRKHGSYKRYMRAPHRDVLACRGLAQRGKLATEHGALNFIARQGDNGIVWTVLSFWRATY